MEVQKPGPLILILDCWFKKTTFLRVEPIFINPDVPANEDPVWLFWGRRMHRRRCRDWLVGTIWRSLTHDIQRVTAQKYENERQISQEFFSAWKKGAAQ